MKSLNEIKTQSKRKLCYDLYTVDCKSIQQISSELAISRQTVSKYIKLYNAANPNENQELAIIQRKKPKEKVVETNPIQDDDGYKFLDPKIVKLLKEKS